MSTRPAYSSHPARLAFGFGGVTMLGAAGATPPLNVGNVIIRALWHAVGA
jgi:hypothetical protein